VNIRIFVTLQSVLVFVFTVLLSPGQVEGADLDAGQKIYAAQCAVCHGTSGRPDPDSPVVKGLGVMPADFSDPLFNSREPAGDWEMGRPRARH
jgi:mono/diheme cytochrome c family protein